MAAFVGAEEALTARWELLATQVEGLPDAIDELLQRHREPQRHYHTAERVEAVLVHLDTLDPSADPALRLAAFFHDAVYDAPELPGNDSNEERSAQLAEQLLAGCDETIVKRTCALIRSTEGHQLVDVAGAAEFLDADLSILGASPDDYDRYAEQIRSEYIHVAEADYRAGRAAVLRRFLERDTLYLTSVAQSLWESIARQNLEREIQTLSEADAEKTTP